MYYSVGAMIQQWYHYATCTNKHELTLTDMATAMFNCITN